MNNLMPYLFFNGQCKAALDFYAHAMGGEITALSTFAEMPGETPPGTEDRIMHATFKAGDIAFMASDSMPDQDIPRSGPVALSLDFTDADEQAAVFHELAEGGEITMALQDTFWGARFGMVTDKFGIQWMLSLSKE
ncbi:VOC family protein [Saccharospirillum salsuginis]|uniref:VOC family protein n=1 Tax=Saccharospirillum salsuginis TaxID=418750 RepID=A0A918K905_9GAMM|nr:VOC family protein [Saccharospirillum salsuginis]GGX54446.1 VOC family protein [Saccharospirillum salsuginis]